MSLLNDVLRELADQNKTSEAVTGDTRTVFPQAPLLSANYFSWLPGILLFIAVFVVVLLVQYIVHKNSLAHHAAIENAAVNAIVETSVNSSINRNDLNREKKIDRNTAPLDNSQLDKTLVDKTNSASVVAADVEKKSIIQAPEATDLLAQQKAESLLQAHIAELMQQAERAIGMERLTAPIEDNAYGYYQKILGINPDYIPAKQGLENIAKLYLLKMEEQKRLGNFLVADTYLQRAKFVAPDFVNSQSITTTPVINTNTQLVSTNHPDNIHQDIASPAEINSHVDAGVVSNRDNNPDASNTQQRESIKPFVVSEAPSEPVAVVENAGWRDEQMAQHARDLIQVGKLTEAQDVLKKFIAGQTKPSQSAVVLADLYLQQNNEQAAKIVIDHADYISTLEKTRINAQIVSSQGDNSAAITLLEQHISDADNNEKYRALLASLYHKTANYQQSVVSYQRLLSSFGEKPAYWLGLALAFDGLSQHKSALQTYKHLREFPQLQPQVRTYIDQRIAVLQSE